MIDEEYGYIKINLDSLIQAKGISKNKLSHKAEVQRSQLNSYCSNKMSRIDLAVLARLCTALDCEINDILEFVPANKK